MDIGRLNLNKGDQRIKGILWDLKGLKWDKMDIKRFRAVEGM